MASLSGPVTSIGVVHRDICMRTTAYCVDIVRVQPSLHEEHSHKFPKVQVHAVSFAGARGRCFAQRLFRGLNNFRTDFEGVDSNTWTNRRN